MERKKLSAAEITEKLNELNGWTAENDVLVKRFTFTNFAEALNFVNQIGVIAEKLDHHPDINFGWGYAEINLTTHDAGGVTEFDFALTEQIENLAENK